MKNVFFKRPGKWDSRAIALGANLVALKVGKVGYFPIFSQASPDELNDEGVTPEIIESAEIGSIFGWDVPGARLAVEFSKGAE